MKRIRAKRVLTSIGKIIANGYITIDESGKILEIGVENSSIPDSEFLDGILIPGFVNAHSHIELSHLEGAFHKSSGMAGFIRQINQLRLNVDEQSRKIAINLQLDKLYKSGVSVLGDISNSDESFNAKTGSKLASRTFLEVFGTEEDDSFKIIENVKNLKQQADQISIAAAPTPHSCYTMSRRLLRESIREGIKSGFISYHNEESNEELELIQLGIGELAKEYKSRSLSIPTVTGSTPLNYFCDILDEIKKSYPDEAFLIDHTRFLLVHNCVTNYNSISRAQSTISNSYWVLCPLSNLFIHNLLPPVELLMQSNCKICIGTDSLSSNDELDMVSEIKTLKRYFPFLNLEDLLVWSTKNGAEALGFENEYGTLEVGKSPGIVLLEGVNLESYELTENSRSIRII